MKQLILQASLGWLLRIISTITNKQNFAFFHLTFALCMLCKAFYGETMVDRLSSIKEGDAVVLDFHRSIAALETVDKSNSRMKIRVVTATKDILARENIASWLKWLQNGAPGSLSDEIVTIRTNDGIEVEEEIETKRIHWLLTLFRLDLTPIPYNHRRKSGPAPQSGEIDLRPLFQPRIIVQGKSIESKSDAFSAHWPNDGSEMSQRLLILYFPISQASVSGFPYWIESPSSTYHVNVIDSSHALQ